MLQTDDRAMENRCHQDRAAMRPGGACEDNHKRFQGQNVWRLWFGWLASISKARRIVTRSQYFRLAPKSGTLPLLTATVHSSNFVGPIFQKVRHEVKNSNTVSRSPANNKSFARLIFGPKLFNWGDPRVLPAASR